MTIAEIIASVLLVVATVLVIATAIALWRAPDALTRVNLLGPTVGLAVPLLLVAKLVVDFAENGFSLWSLGRSIYGVTVTDVKYAKRMRQQAQTVEASEEEV